LIIDENESVLLVLLVVTTEMIDTNTIGMTTEKTGTDGTTTTTDVIKLAF
jgi:hypothetical protein